MTAAVPRQKQIASAQSKRGVLGQGSEKSWRRRPFTPGRDSKCEARRCANNPAAEGVLRPLDRQTRGGNAGLLVGRGRN